MSESSKDTKNSDESSIFKRFIVVISITFVMFMMAFLMLWSSIKLGIDVQCPFKHIFHIDCPGCGITRMCKAIIRGDFYQAFRYNVYVFSTLPILAVVYIWQSYEYILHNKLLKYIDTFLVTYAVLMITFGIIRNIPLFSALAPTIVK